MGLFSFLTTSKPAYSDKVWKTQASCWRGMITDALQCITQNQIPVVFTFFQQTEEELIAFLHTSGVPYFQINADTVGNAAEQTKVVFVCNAWTLTSSVSLVQFLQSVGKKSTANFFFAGHYPLPDKEKKVIDKLALIAPTAPIVFCSSLADASFAMFGADRISTLLDQLGLQEDENIEHPFVTKSMQRAREKIQSEVVHEITANSEVEWFEKNVKSKK